MKVFEERRLISVEVLRSAVIIFYLFVSLLGVLMPSNTSLMQDSFYFFKFDSFVLFLWHGLLNGIFVFLFSVGVSWRLIKRIEKGRSFWKELIYAFALCLLFMGVDLFYAGFLAQSSLLPFSENRGGGVVPLFFQTGKIVFPTGEQFFQGGLFAMLGISLLLMVFLIVLLYSVQKRIPFFSLPFALGIIGVFWLIFFGNLSGKSLSISKSFFFAGGIYKIGAWFIYNWAGRNFALIGILPFSIFGAIFGLLLHKSENIKEFNYSVLFYLLILFGFILFMLGADLISVRVSGSNEAVRHFNVRISILITLFILFVLLYFLTIFFDLKGKFSKRFSSSQIVDHFRKIGQIFLTMYLWQSFILEFFSGFKESRFEGVLNGNQVDNLSIFSTFLFCLALFSFWILFFSFAHLLKYRGTVEYVFFQFFSIVGMMVRKIRKLPTLSAEKTENQVAGTDLLLFYLDVKHSEKKS